MLRCIGEEHLQTFQSNGVIWKSEENSKERISFQKNSYSNLYFSLLKMSIFDANIALRTKLIWRTHSKDGYELNLHNSWVWIYG